MTLRSWEFILNASSSDSANHLETATSKHVSLKKLSKLLYLITLGSYLTTSPQAFGSTHSQKFWPPIKTLVSLNQEEVVKLPSPLLAFPIRLKLTAVLLVFTC